MIRRVLGYGGWALVALVAWVFFLVWYWPAGMAVGMSERQGWLPPGAEWGTVTGSIWSGAINSPAWQGWEAEELAWSVTPARLLRGEMGLAFRLNDEGGRVHGQAWLNPSGATLRDVRVELDGATLAERLGEGAMGPVALGGTFRGEVREAALTPEGQLRHLDARMAWHDAAVDAPMAMALGDLSGDFAGADGQIEGQLQDHGGPLRLEATVSIDPNMRWQMEGHLGAREIAEDALPQALEMTGQRNADGLYPVQLQGQVMP